MNKIPIFDGHNDTVHKIHEFCGPDSNPAGIDFLASNTSNHLDLPRARAGGLFGGFFALWVPAEHPTEDALTATETSYAVRLAEPLDLAYARRSIAAQLAALKSLVARSNGQLRIVTTA